MFNKKLLLLLLLFTSIVFCISIPSVASAEQSFNSKISNQKYGDFLYWDGDDIVWAGGYVNEGPSGVRFSPSSSGSMTFNPDVDKMSIPGDIVKQQLYYHDGYCKTMPLTGDNNGTRLEIRVDNNGYAVIDLVGDGSGGSYQGSTEFKWGEVDHGIVTKTNDCNYKLNEGFNLKYSKASLQYLQQDQPYAGKILGKKGVPFDEWIKKADNTNVFKSYDQTALENSANYCRDNNDPNGCFNKLYDSFSKCYAKNIGEDENTKLDKDDISKDYWKKDLDGKSFYSCMVDDESTDDLFDSKESKKDFVRRLMEDANAKIPESVRPDIPPKEDNEDGESSGPNETECSIAYIGWFMCPVLNFVASMTDKLYELIQNWLYVQPFAPSAGTNRMDMSYQVWGMMRNIANVIFVLLFLGVIYSQITGQGLSSYGIKKIGPRLIVTVILVNVSFLICSLGVDLSNVIGDSVYKVVHFSLPSSISSNTDDSSISTWSGVTTSIVMAGGAAAGTVLTLSSLAALVPLLLMAFLAMVATFLMLLLRQAIIIILVVVSPIAFALFLLPNTKKWFSRWRSLFVKLLMLYPAVSLLFAGSYFASRAVLENANENGETLLAIFSLAIQTIPLFITPLLIKFTGSSMGKLGSTVMNTKSGPMKGVMNKANQFRDDRNVLKQTRALNGKKGVFGVSGSVRRYEARRKNKLQYHKNELDRQRAIMLGQQKESNNISKKVGGSNITTGDTELKNTIQNQLQEQMRKHSDDDLKASSVLVEQQLYKNNGENNPIDSIMKQALDKKDEFDKDITDSQREAAIPKSVENSDTSNVNKLVDKSNKETGDMTDRQREIISDSLNNTRIKKEAAHLSNEDARSSVRNGTASVGDLYKKAFDNGLYTPSSAVQQSAESIQGMQKAYDEGYIGDTEISEFKKQFSEGLANPKNAQFSSPAAEQAVRNLGNKVGS